MNLKSNDCLDLNELLNLNREGIFPGPQESADVFCRRIEKVRTGIAMPGPALTEEEWEAAHQITKPLFDIQPTWVPAFYGDKKLSFWEAAAVWDCDGRSVVQLRSRFAKGGRGSRGNQGAWRLVKQQEVLAHEAAHAARMAFRESRFEEMICYQTSRLSWRRRFGPLFRHSWEAALCAGAAAISWILGFFGALSLALIIPWIPFVFYLLRLIRDRALFQRCLKNIRPLLITPDQALAVALRLTDPEILLFARSSPAAIVAYIREQQGRQLRWQVIAAAYIA